MQQARLFSFNDSVLGIGNPLRLLPTVSKDAGRPHPDWGLIHVILLHRPACCNQAVLFVSFLSSMSKDLHLSHPTPTPQAADIHQCPKSCKYSIKFGVSKGRPCGKMCGQCLQLTSEHTCRYGIHREDSRGTRIKEKWDPSTREGFQFVPCIHKTNPVAWPFIPLHLYGQFPAPPRALFGASHYAMVGTSGKAGVSTLTLGDF